MVTDPLLLLFWDHLFITYAKLSETLTFLSPPPPPHPHSPLIQLRTCACQAVRNVSFSKYFAYVINGWFPYVIKYLVFGRKYLVFGGRKYLLDYRLIITIFQTWIKKLKSSFHENYNLKSNSTTTKLSLAPVSHAIQIILTDILYSISLRSL